MKRIDRPSPYAIRSMIENELIINDDAFIQRSLHKMKIKKIVMFVE